LQFGIDLGTTHSLIAVFRNGAAELIPNALGEVLTPSVVALHEGHLLTGRAARAVALAHPERAAAVFKRAWARKDAFGWGIRTMPPPNCLR
jgi:molecular chaperone HscC